MLMDLPVSRIKNADARLDGHDIVVHDNKFNKVLVTLSDDVTLNSYVTIINFEVDGEQVIKAMTFKSDFEYQSLNRRMIISELSSKLSELNIFVSDIGFYYKSSDGTYVGRNKVNLEYYDETGEFICHYNR